MAAKAHFLVTAAAEALALDAGESYLIGRQTGADFVVRSAEASREHARLLWGEGAGVWRIENGAPPNGTFVNDTRLRDHEVCDLQHGDRIGIGLSTSFRFLWVDPEGVERVAGSFGLMKSTAVVDPAGPSGSLGRGETKRFSASTARHASVARLTPRELEVAELAATGLSNGEVAHRLGSRPGTVKKQLSSVYRKLSVRGRIELVELLRG